MFRLQFDHWLIMIPRMSEQWKMLLVILTIAWVPYAICDDREEIGGRPRRPVN